MPQREPAGRSAIFLSGLLRGLSRAMRSQDARRLLGRWYRPNVRWQGSHAGRRIRRAVPQAAASETLQTSGLASAYESGYCFVFVVSGDCIKQVRSVSRGAQQPNLGCRWCERGHSFQACRTHRLFVFRNSFWRIWAKRVVEFRDTEGWIQPQQSCRSALGFLRPTGGRIACDGDA
jgi:hypothetical protein